MAMSLLLLSNRYLLTAFSTNVHPSVNYNSQKLQGIEVITTWSHLPQIKQTPEEYARLFLEMGFPPWSWDSLPYSITRQF